MAALSPAPLSSPDFIRLQAFLEYVVQSEPGCLTLFHAFLFVLILTGLLVQRTLLGDINDTERDTVVHAVQHLVFKNILFIFYVLNPETLSELMFWLGWLCGLSLLKGFCEFCNVRVAELSQASSLSTRSIRSLTLFITLTCVLNSLYFVLVIYSFSGRGLRPLLFILYEPLYMLMDLAQTTVKFILHLQWLRKASPIDEYCYFNDIVFDVAKLTATIGHFSHILMYFFSISIIDLLLFTYNCKILQQMQLKIEAAGNYIKATRAIHDQYPTATPEQVQKYGDPCAICYDSLSADALVLSQDVHMSTKVLPCNHIFHMKCIRRWMEHQSCCPICKRELIPTAPALPCSHTEGVRALGVTGGFIVPWLPTETWGLLQTMLQAQLQTVLHSPAALLQQQRLAGLRPPERPSPLSGDYTPDVSELLPFPAHNALDGGAQSTGGSDSSAPPQEPPQVSCTGQAPGSVVGSLSFPS
uniref:RING-type domain-containing protein n=1 Tax=Eutreptiella gymnastica TaxID=73025 RepID=A0A7S4D041_9EUGL